jgi:glycosyltransferase involved in cell wall biosynthesis
VKILWFSDSPWTATGYGVQTRLFVPRMGVHGHELAVATKFGLEGALLRWCGCQLYPRGHHPYSQDVLAAHARHFGADLVLTLCDAWICEPALLRGVRWVPWIPVDADPLPEPLRERLACAYQPVVFSRFGQRVAADAGIEARYIPLAVDAEIYRWRDRPGARERTGIPADRFVVGMVADNKDPRDRKAFGPQLAAFAAFRARHPDALLYLHTNLGQDGRGLDLVALMDALGLEIGRDVLVADQYLKLVGYPDEQMADLYASLNVLLGVSSWEGFGVPLIEAQACGVPVIAGDWTAMGELVAAGWRVPASETEPRADELRGIVRVPRVGAIVEALEHAYAGLGAAALAMGTAAMMAYGVDWVAREQWAPLLAQLADRVADGPRSVAEAVSA